MLQAQLRGKLSRKEEDMEDLLTSNVFGSIKYVSLSEGLAPILASSEDMNGNKGIQLLQEIAEAHYEFWPRLKEQECNACEPDVLIRVKFANDRKALLLIEAKYHSDKSSFADENVSPRDQLACEWHNLARRGEIEHALPILLYVTADLAFPVEDIRASQEELRSKGLPEMTVFWVSWRRIYSLFSSVREETILKDLSKVLQRAGLTFYEGRQLWKPIGVDWAFKTQVHWEWSYRLFEFEWEFSQNKGFNWQFRNRAIKWRLNN